ncbi:unnamed protein product [Paramecium pentaurelia]|uniref:Transmembrane protein n=1 Tax=Paramecium pentaurelia TaxID=43138 RepID=A0A8S1S2G8_9CILI|nr:unnamed protein product [Paramecium pentaurelia]
MIIILVFLYLAHSLYLLEYKSNNLMINLDTSSTAIISLQGLISQIYDEDNDQYCPYGYNQCWMALQNNNTDTQERVQLKIKNFSIYDEEMNTYNTEFITFYNPPIDFEINHLNINFLTLSPLTQFFNSFVYFGYSLCRSGQDAYLKTRQNENLQKNRLNINGIKSQIYHQEDSVTYSIRISYLECFDQVFDISNYQITILDGIEIIILPIELFQRIKIFSKQNEFYEYQSDDENNFFYRDTNSLRVEFINPIKFYNVKEQPLLIMPEDYIFYNYENLEVDFLKLIGNSLKSEIILGSSFLKNKIIHFTSFTQEIFIEQLLEDKCNLQLNQKDVSIYQDLVKLIIILIFSIFIYAIFRRIRVKYLLKVQNKRVDQQLILNETQILK